MSLPLSLLVRNFELEPEAFSTVSGRELSYGLIQGDVFAILPGEPHAYSESKNLIIYNIAFQSEIIADLLPEFRELPSWNALFDPTPEIYRHRVHLKPQAREEAIKAAR